MGARCLNVAWLAGRDCETGCGKHCAVLAQLKDAICLATTLITLRIAIASSGMLHCAMFLATCLVIVTGGLCYFQIVSFCWFFKTNIATQVARGIERYTVQCLKMCCSIAAIVGKSKN